MLVGPVGVGSYKFVFQADPPDVTKIPNSDILGVTVLLLTCSYNDTEFIRVGYYVNNEYGRGAARGTPRDGPSRPCRSQHSGGEAPSDALPVRV